VSSQALVVGNGDDADDRSCSTLSGPASGL